MVTADTSITVIMVATAVRDAVAAGSLTPDDRAGLPAAAGQPVGRRGSKLRTSLMLQTSARASDAVQPPADNEDAFHK